MRFYFLLLCLDSLLNVGAALPNEQRKPNVIVIDGGRPGKCVDVGCYGSRDLTTPRSVPLPPTVCASPNSIPRPRFAPPPVPGS